ncbi:MAG: hypothetical protein EOP00_07725 [Pedobacter sp.]|nr:MAG: hypothetical protein EOP00_07725 [Pedobacter sp.]
MSFKSTKSKFFIVVIIVTLIGLVTLSVTQFFLVDEDIKSIIILQAICWLCIAFLLWVYVNTQYRIDKAYLFYSSGPISGKIEISKIYEVVIGQKIIPILKPATGNNGLVIKYNRWDEIYLSPNTNGKFIEELLKLNDKIKVTDLRKIV